MTSELARSVRNTGKFFSVAISARTFGKGLLLVIKISGVSSDVRKSHGLNCSDSGKPLINAVSFLPMITIRLFSA